MSKVTIKDGVQQELPGIDAASIPNGTFFRAGGYLWYKAGGCITNLDQGSKSICWTASHGTFDTYQPVDVEITYTPCK